MSYDYQTRNYNEIKLDTLNPRLPKSLHNKNESTILEYMLLQADVLSLVEAIGENGFFPGEPIIITKDNDDDELFKVIEGNRRLSAIKLINNPSLAPVLVDRVRETVENIDPEIKKDLDKIACLIVTEDEIGKSNKFLGFRHITGTKNWKSLERARYLQKLYKEFKEKDPTLPEVEIYRELARTIGTKSNYIKRILTGFNIYSIIENKKFFHINNGGLNDQNFHFVNLADSLNRSNITKYLGVDLQVDNSIEELNIESVENWTKWLFEKESGTNTRVKGTSEKLGSLDKILGCDEAKVEFIINNKTLEESLKYTDAKEVLFTTLITKAITNLSDAEKPLHVIKEYDLTLESNLKHILSLCTNLNNINNSKKEENQDVFKLN